MKEEIESEHIPHKNKNIAYHMDWSFRKEAAIWKNGKPIIVNFHPLATKLRNWLLRQGDLTYFHSKDKKLPNAYTNPYTYDGSILAITFSQIINDSNRFAKSKESIDSLEAELKRIRFYTEQVLYTARLCEAFIKQLLFCTTFPEGDYRGSALGSLLSKDCNGCKSSKDKRHKISLLGSLAHKYGLCTGYEQCLSEHMKIVNRRRDVEAAHTGLSTFIEQDSSASRKQLGDSLISVGDEFIHMLGHIADIERLMVDELTTMIGSYDFVMASFEK